MEMVSAEDVFGVRGVTHGVACMDPPSGPGWVLLGPPALDTTERPFSPKRRTWVCPSVEQRSCAKASVSTETVAWTPGPGLETCVPSCLQVVC